MQKNEQALFQAIQAKCQQSHWFGPDALNPEREFLSSPDDPFIDEYAAEIVAPDHAARSGFVFSPATEEQIHTTERRLGFTLPPLLRLLYLQLANGGFGPGSGLCGVDGGYRYQGAYPQQKSVQEPSSRKTFSYVTYQEQATQARTKGIRAGMLVPAGERLEHLLPLCDLGCCEEVGVDEQGRMFLSAPTENNAFYHLEQLPWTLEQWLWRWVRGENLLELYQPGAA